ncbi:MAG: LysM peptidoglycan-binding domain-containing protein, partial [Anaerolineales bacterium]
MNNKGTARDIIEEYRKRQKWMQITPLILFAVVLLVVVGVGLLFNYLRDTGIPSFSEAADDTPSPTEMLVTELNNTATLSPTQAMEMLFTEIPFEPEETQTPEELVYTVREGDTLDSIARQFNLTIQEIMTRNPELDPDLINVGQRIVIPATSELEGISTPLPEDFQGMVEYQIVSGDTLFDIAIRYNTTVEAIVQANQLANPDDIMVGDILRIPVGDITSEPPV